MSLFATLTRKKPKDEAPSVATAPCPHWEMGPHWDSAVDMGHRDRVTYYSCSACGQTFTPLEVEHARNS